MSEEEPWSRPATSAFSNRPGDREELPIYTELGRAVSNWEGISAATALLFRALIDEADRSEINTETVEQFGGLNNVHKRAKKINDQARWFFDADFGSNNDKARILRDELPLLMATYRGWAERRNDLAHGYVTRADGPDYEREDQPIITTFTLCPSHARHSKWPHSEPEYNYTACEIAHFANAFHLLDQQIETTAECIESLRECRSNTPSLCGDPTE